MEAKQDDFIAAEIAGCCRRCQLRFMGCRLPQYYFYTQDEIELSDDDASDSYLSPKRIKIGICSCCLGLLQPTFWSTIVEPAKDQMTNIGYDCNYFACGLSLPASIMLREHSMITHLKEVDPKLNTENIVPFKQAWKWSFGPYMAKLINKELDSGSISQFLITLHMDYKFDQQELESLKKMVPHKFEERRKCHRKFRGETFTRASVVTYLEKIDPTVFKQYFDCPPKTPDELISCSNVEFNHSPLYLGGRYIKLSRELPQTPWIIGDKRIMENSIQEIIFEPLIDFFGISPSLVDNQMKFISSGREDVDVRCLGEGRPFVIEILNPTISNITSEKLKKIEESMSACTNFLQVISLSLVKRESLTLLKMGETSKTKTYEALCIKLPDSSQNIINGNKIENESPLIATVTDHDIHIINTYSNIPNESGVLVEQKTPIRVLHRRPLLNRLRKIIEMKATSVKGKSNMFTIVMTTEAGTYIKEFIHGDFGRTMPNLSHILGFRVDILALDVKSVNMKWP